LNQKRASIVVLALFTAFLLGDARFGLLQGYDNYLSDALLRIAGRSYAPDPDIVLLTADERSVTVIGEEVDRWPWPRDVFGEVGQAIAAQRPAAIVFDMAFSDPDVARRSSDEQMSALLGGATNIYFPLVRQDPAGDAWGVSLRSLAPYAGLDPGFAPDAKANILLPRALRRDLWRLGAINFRPDADGVGRLYPIRIDVHGWPLPSLGARVARDLGYRVPDRKDIVLSWPSTTHKSVSFVDVFDDVRRASRGEATMRPASEFTGKIVVIGTDATGISDLHPTPRNHADLGSDIIATAIDNLKHERFLEAAPRGAAAVIGVVLLVAIWAAFWAGLNSLVVGGMLIAATVALYAIAYLALDRRIVLHVTAPLLIAWAFYAVMALMTYVAERDLRLRTTQMFSRFVNPVVVAQLLAEGGFPRTGVARDITVMFCDIRGFTTLSERMEPAALVDLLNRHFGLHVDLIFRHQGTLDKFIGDAMMALWGAPIDDPRQAEHAVACALDMVDAFKRFRADLPPELAAFDFGIGIHSGQAVVGLVGPDSRPEYTAMGDTVNVASRIEGLTADQAHLAMDASRAPGAGAPAERCRILVSKETRDRAGDAFDFLPRGRFKVKGRNVEVDVFEPKRKAP
jgi:adenylate cyclase